MFTVKQHYHRYVATLDGLRGPPVRPLSVGWPVGRLAQTDRSRAVPTAACREERAGGCRPASVQHFGGASGEQVVAMDHPQNVVR
jgi:hypothetical protein